MQQKPSCAFVKSVKFLCRNAAIHILAFLRNQRQVSVALQT